LKNQTKKLYQKLTTILPLYLILINIFQTQSVMIHRCA